MYAQNLISGSYANQLTFLIKAGENNFDDLYDGIIPVNEPFRGTNYVTLSTDVMESSRAYLISISQNYPNFQLRNSEFITMKALIM